MQCSIKGRPEKLNAEVDLPASKSISNRVLIIRYLCGSDFIINNLSQASDTQVLARQLEDPYGTIDIGDAGTAARFLTAALAVSPQVGTVTLYGSARIRQRPMAPLIDALREIGAEITCIENEGFIPLRIKGHKLEGGSISIDASMSSQFISALLMVAPLMEKGLFINFNSPPVSTSYIELTMDLMKYYGVTCQWMSDEQIFVPPAQYGTESIHIEGDWSSASYWYGLVALTNDGKAQFHDLEKESKQGDRAIASYMEEFGVTTYWGTSLTQIEKVGNNPAYFVKDMVNTPDLIPTMVVLCSCLNISCRIKGTRTLSLKESDRVAVMQRELQKVGYHIEVDEDEIKGMPSQESSRKEAVLDPAGDHRMAMAFALQAFINPNVAIKDAEVVDKSFPTFWETLVESGVEVMETDDK